MSWFDDVEIDDIPDNPNELPDNTYKFRVISAKVGPTKDGSKTGITFKYQIVEGDWATFFPLTDWVQVPEDSHSGDAAKRMLSFIKMRLLGFGLTSDEIRKFGPNTVQDLCVNRHFYGTTRIKKDGDNTQIRVHKFDPIGDGEDTLIDFPDPNDFPNPNKDNAPF